MVTSKEWKEYFETVNGRTPSIEEFQEAKRNGEFGGEVQATSRIQETDSVIQTQTDASMNSDKKTEFINYYEELGLSQTNGVDEIKVFLDEKFNEARSRIQKMPEKYKLIMNLVEKARKVFDTEESKAKYDKELEEANKIPEAPKQIDERKVRFNDLFKSVQKYYSDGVYDLASEELEEMERYRDAMPHDEIDSRILASRIYNASQQYQKSIKTINKAIVLQPKFPFSHRLKFIAMYNINLSSDENKDKATRFTKANELGALLKKYVDAVKNWEYSTKEDINDAEDFAAGYYFFGLSDFYNPKENLFYSDKLIDNQNAKIGKGIADKHVSMKASACVLEAYEFAIKKRIAFQEMKEAEKVLGSMKKFKISGGMYKFFGVLFFLSLFGDLAFFLIIAAVFLALLLYQNSQSTSYKKAQARVHNAEQKCNALWSEGVLPAYNKWKRLHLA